MGRNKVLNRNLSVSISILQSQKQFIDNNPKFNLSKFVQLHLNDYINLSKEVEKIQKEVNLKTHDKIE